MTEILKPREVRSGKTGELIDILIAISVISKQLATKLQREMEEKNDEQDKDR